MAKMKLKLADNVKANVEIDDVLVINMENSLVYESIESEEAFIYIKSVSDKPDEPIKEVKIRFLKK